MRKGAHWGTDCNDVAMIARFTYALTEQLEGANQCSGRTTANPEKTHFCTTADAKPQSRQTPDHSRPTCQFLFVCGTIRAMKGNEKVLEQLNQALREELTAINQYFLPAEMCENWGYDKLSKYIKKQSIGEMKHAEALIERILFLDGHTERVRATAST